MWSDKGLVTGLIHGHNIGTGCFAHMKPSALLLCALFAAATSARLKDPLDGMDLSWQNNYKPWRQRDTVTLEAWKAAIPDPVKAPSDEKWAKMDLPKRKEHFHDCITEEAKDFSKRVLKYKSPDAQEVQTVRRRNCFAVAAGCCAHLCPAPRRR